MRKIVILLAIICGLFFKFPVCAEVIEVSRPPEITEITLDLERKVITTTDSWKVSACIINIDPSDINYIRVGWRYNSTNLISIKLYYNPSSCQFEGEYNNIDGLSEGKYSFYYSSVALKNGTYPLITKSFDRNSLTIVVNNNCAKNLHTVYADSYEQIKYSYFDVNCTHKVTKGRKCNICGEITDTKHYEPTFSYWSTNNKGEKGRICSQCQRWVKVPFLKKGTIITWYSNKYRIIVEGEAVELISPIKQEESVIVPINISYDGLTYYVTSIASGAFKNNTKMKKLTIYGYVKNIGKQAFYGCKNLKNITIFTTSLTSKSIGSQAFTKAGSSNYKKLIVSVPKSKKKSYIKLLRKSGLNSKAKIK